MEPIYSDAPPVLRPLTSALQTIAEQELHEVPHHVADNVLALRQWIEKQPHLRARTNDQFLVGFLRGSKFNLEKAKQKIDRFYALRAGIPEIFNERRIVDDPMVLEIIRMGVILRIPLKDDYAGPCITIIRAGLYDTNKYKFADIIRVGSMFGEIMLQEDDNSTVSGFVEVMDMSSISASHFFQLKPELLRKFLVFADEAMPMRQRGTHFINVPPPFEKGFNSLKTFLPAKMLSRITVSSDPDAIFEHIPQKYLPIEYGGENGTMQDIVDRMEAKIIQYRDFFLDDVNYGTDEKKREGAPFNYESCFGMEGSFRRLEID